MHIKEQYYFTVFLYLNLGWILYHPCIMHVFQDGAPVFGWPSLSAEYVAVFLVSIVYYMECVTAAGV